MDKIRLATKDEVEKIWEGSDITPTSTVVAFDNRQGTSPDFAVIRQVFEIDPMRFAPETTDRRKALFAWALENALRIQGTIPGYYFNISAADEAQTWRENCESFGAVKVSHTPEFRYFKSLA